MIDYNPTFGESLENLLMQLGVLKDNNKSNIAHHGNADPAYGATWKYLINTFFPYIARRDNLSAQANFRQAFIDEYVNRSKLLTNYQLTPFQWMSILKGDLRGIRERDDARVIRQLALSAGYIIEGIGLSKEEIGQALIMAAQNGDSDSVAGILGKFWLQPESVEQILPHDINQAFQVAVNLNYTNVVSSMLAFLGIPLSENNIEYAFKYALLAYKWPLVEFMVINYASKISLSAKVMGFNNVIESVKQLVLEEENRTLSKVVRAMVMTPLYYQDMPQNQLSEAVKCCPLAFEEGGLSPLSPRPLTFQYQTALISTLESREVNPAEIPHAKQPPAYINNRLLPGFK